MFDCAYIFLLVILLPFWVLAIPFSLRLRRYLTRGKTAGKPEGKPILFHCASVGEFLTAKPLIKELRNRGHAIAISVNTRAAYELIKLQMPDVFVCFLPFDFSWRIRRFHRELQPKLVIIMEREIWPNFIKCSPAPVILVNGRMSDGSFRFYSTFRVFS